MALPQQQAALELAVRTHFDPDDLVVGAANAQAFDLLQNWPHWRNPTTILIGAAGSGKSHMAHLWAQRAAAKSFTPNQLDRAVKHLESGGPILVEDIMPGLFDETALFHLINGVMQARLTMPKASLLLTSRLPPIEWQLSLADLASRLRAAQLVEISQADDSLLIAVVTKLFADRQLLVEPQLIRYSVSRMERSLEAAVNFVAEIDRLALEKKSKINRQLILHLLENKET